MEKFNERLKFLRTKVLKMTTRPMAEQLNVSQGSISHYERALALPGYEFIVSLCNEFGVSANWLILGINPVLLKDIGSSISDTAITKFNRDKDLEEKIEQATNLLQDIPAGSPNFKASAIEAFFIKSLSSIP